MFTDKNEDEIVLYTEKSWQQMEWATWFLGWSCMEECCYHCMWKTLQEKQRNDKNAIFKFHGKVSFIVWACLNY